MEKLVYLLLALFVASCSNSKISDYVVDLVESNGILRISVDSDINLYDRCVRYYEDDEGEYITLRRLFPAEIYDELAFIDIHNGNNVANIKVYREGPNAINGGLYGYDIINKDTIVLSSKYLPILYFLNNSGKVIKKISLDRSQGQTESLMLSMVNKPLALKANRVDFPQDVPYTRAPLKPNNPSFKFSECPLAYIVDLQTEEVEKSLVSFPHLYDNDDKVNHSESYSRVFDGSNYVYSFFKYDSLIVTSDYKTSKSYIAKSKYIGDVKNVGVAVGSSMEELMKLTKLATYDNIVYDKYRSVYYRFCYFDNDYPGPFPLEYSMCKGSFTIMIINSDFQVIGETVFPAGKYAPKIFFVNKEGLWLSENNFQRNDMTDDVLAFRCLKLVEKK